MKKLNSKGFTLVELLAVIIILAIVVGVTIPAVLTTLNNTKVKSGKTAALTVADWIDRQYQIQQSGLEASGIATLDAYYSAQCNPVKTTCECAYQAGTNKCATGYTKTITDADFIGAAGLQKTNITNIKVSINTKTGRSCVLLTIPDSSDYYTGSAPTCASGEKNCYSSQTEIKAGSC